MEQGVTHVIRETFHSCIEAGKLTFQSIGFLEKEARRIAEMFRDHDERQLTDQFGDAKDEAAVQAAAVAWASELKEIFAADAEADKEPTDDTSKS